MRTSFRTSFLVAVAAALILQGCQKENNEELISGHENSPSASASLKSRINRTFYGPSVPIGDGIARAWVTENFDGEPTAVGVNLSEKAIENLPHEPFGVVLSLPKNKGKNFYDHVLLDWNPEGHEPPGDYDIPHFDVHFYIISNVERMAIGPLAPPAFDPAPAAMYQPPLYFQTPGAVPGMGAHWIDVLAPEFNGGEFTNTFIWGSSNGKFVFWEPMVTLEYLQSHPDDIRPLRQPTAYEVPGWYAQDYVVTYSDHPGEFTIALMNLVQNPPAD
jgi:hypothetical protein